MQYDETIDYLYALQWHGIKLGLENPMELLSRLGSPEEGDLFAHLAGTNGKGSTASMLRSMLGASGLRAGLFTSPHLLSFTERISICTDNLIGHITEDEVVSLAAEIRLASEGMQPTFFEVVTAMGFLYFRRHEADCAVIETGMGGRLDATNVITPRVVLITPIGLDHAEFLGHTLTEVASEKAGIIKPGVPVICASQEPGAMKVIESVAQELGAPMHMYGREFGAENIERYPDGVRFDYSCGTGTIKGLRIPLRGEFQARNAALAIRGLEKMTGGLDEDAIRRGLQGLKWPGRLELVNQEPPVYIDGAHNPAAAAAVADELMESGLGQKMCLVLGVMSDKDAEGIIKPLLPLAKEVFLTRASYGRAALPEDLAPMVREAGFLSGQVHEVPRVEHALRSAMEKNSPVLVTGSFYTAGEAMEALGARSVLGTLRESAPEQSEEQAEEQSKEQPKKQPKKSGAV